MILTEFRVSGYKSLYDCTITDLQPINVFHGDNNVGKSNILEALELFCRVLKGDRSPPLADAFAWGEEAINLQGLVTLPGKDTLKVEVDFNQAHVSPVQAHVSPAPVLVNGAPQHPQALSGIFGSALDFYRIPARRRLETEQETQPELPLDPTGTNLKERLFWASVSQDPDERKAFYNVLRPLFAESPLALGTLQPVAAPGGPYNLQIETPTRSVPLEQMGSGIQQLVLLSGLITLSRAAIIAIEEPEMNLSWPTQKKLRLILQRMVEQRDAPPHQIFISSHSPLFEFYENFYRVEMVDGRTQVTRVENAERRRIFDGVLPPADKRAAWLHGENVVILPSYVVETLDVQQGDLVYFLPQKDRVLMLGEEDFADMTRPGDEEA
jgi:hypothetical protein